MAAFTFAIFSGVLASAFRPLRPLIRLLIDPSLKTAHTGEGLSSDQGHISFQNELETFAGLK